MPLLLQEEGEKKIALVKFFGGRRSSEWSQRQ
jgi:hypothetical protein